MSPNIRGIKQEVRPAPKYLPRLNQTETEREIVAADWEAQLPTIYPLLAKTPKTIEVLGGYLAEVRFTVEALNQAVEDCRGQLEWLQPLQPPKKETVMSDTARREDGSVPTFDYSSRSHVTIDRENKLREEQRKAELAAKVAEREKAKKPTQPKSEPVRQNIGLDGNSGQVPGKINHAKAGSTASGNSLPDQCTVSQFKAASREAKLKWMAEHPKQNPLPDPKTEAE